MAKSGAEPAGASGSQFFVVTAEDAQLPPDYALLGKVTEGQDVVDGSASSPTTRRRAARRAGRDPVGQGLGALGGARQRALELQQHPLALGAAAVVADPAAAREHAVAGHDDRDRVAGAGGRGGAEGARAARSARRARRR